MTDAARSDNPVFVQQPGRVFTVCDTWEVDDEGNTLYTVVETMVQFFEDELEAAGDTDGKTAKNEQGSGTTTERPTHSP